MTMNSSNVACPESQIQAPLVSEESFKGYTLEELRYNRALTALKAEFCREKMITDFKAMTSRTSLAKIKGASGSGFFKSGIVSKMLKSLNYLDYMVAGAAAFKAIRSVTSLFKSRK